jgi:protein-disulfide isomerase
MKKNHIWTTTLILVMGIIIGFLIGRISIKEQITTTPQASSDQTVLSVEKSATNQPQPPTIAAITPKTLDQVDGVSIDDDYVLGRTDAPLTIIEFTDYQCPFCKKYFDNVFSKIKSEYINTGKIRYVIRDFPLDEHPQALLAANAAQCAGEQGKYFEMHDQLFTEQNKWSYQSNALSTFKTYGTKLGLEANKFNACLDSGKYESEIAKDIADAEKYTVLSTPTIFINNSKIVGAQSYDLFKTTIDSELAKAAAKNKKQTN